MAVYKQYESYVKNASQKYGVPENIIWAVITQESSGRSDVTNKQTGAMGLMQLMPDTAAEYGVADAYDPAQNIDGGTHLLADLLERWDGDEEAALASYFAGSGNVSKHGKSKYSRYYTSVLEIARKMSGGVVNWFLPDASDVLEDSGILNGIKGSNLSWWGDILLSVVLVLCLILGVVFIYFAINGIPSAVDVVKKIV